MNRASTHQLNEDDVVIARIVKARGIRGEVACDLATDFPERFETLAQVTVALPGGLRQSLVLEDHWFHQDRIILKFAGIDTMTDAERLAGALLVIPQSDAWQLEEDEFYEYDLIGMEVVLEEVVLEEVVREEVRSGGATDAEIGKRETPVKVGRVIRLLPTGASDLLVVESEDESGGRRERLIPFVDEICKEVDVERRRIVINPPAGLLDL